MKKFPLLPLVLLALVFSVDTATAQRVSLTSLQDQIAAQAALIDAEQSTIDDLIAKLAAFSVNQAGDVVIFGASGIGGGEVDFTNGAFSRISGGFVRQLDSPHSWRGGGLFQINQRT